MDKKLQDFIDEYAPYLDDLRLRLLDLAASFIVIFAAAFLGAGYIIKLFVQLFNIKEVIITVTSPFQYLDLAFDIGLFVAIIGTFPFALAHSYLFLKPALSKKEKKIFLYSAIFSILLFVLGFVYGLVVLYGGLEVLASLNESVGLKNIWDISRFLSQMAVTASLLGILFQFPIVISTLIKLDITTAEWLKERRAASYALMLILVALLPPTDGLSLLIMTLPMVLLYEVTLVFNS